MNCENHPDRAVVAVCEKQQVGFCEECCACEDLVECCACRDPKLYCQFRTQCLIWEYARERRRRE